MTEPTLGSTATTGGSTTDQVKERVKETGQGLADSARHSAQDARSEAWQTTRS